ncbi:MAG TPA: long-chain fatty acid--CoA ligase [Solirubrobacteraceae bacterium]|nr:long-chain fatty acid--CoA ligase [Solirubrobacteraceae bacterium]
MAPTETALEHAGQPASAAGTSPPHTVGEHLLAVTGRHSGVALQFWRNGVPAYISYPELATISSEIARGLISLGIDAGDRVAILGLTSAQWTLADCGALCAGAVVAPIYHTNSPSECAYVLAHSGARVVICEDAAQAAKIAQVRDQCPALEQVVLFENDGGELLTLDGLRRLGSEVPPDAVRDRLESMGQDELATLVYTSGTTGPPKGCMLSHRNLLETARLYVEQLGFDDSHSLYQFLPLAHVLARVAQIVALSVGARIIYWSGDPSRIIAELQETSPTHFPAVPRVYEKVHSVAIGRARQGSRVQRAVFDWALRCGTRARGAVGRREQPALLTDLQYRLADPLVLAKVRAAFGPKLQLGLIGAAPVSPDLLEFFDACGVLVLEGYGLTETCAAATLNTPDAYRFGTVGRPLPGTQVAIAADGEILIRGPHVFAGYYNDPAATEAALTADGWLRSGDLGAIDAQGFLKITGRKKDLIITSSGKNITPVNIESELRDQPAITEAVVYGDNRPYLVAMLTLDREESVKLARRLGIDTDRATIAGDARVHAEIQKQVDAVNAKFARIEQVKRFAILDHDLTQADGELTPTLKVKRAAVYERYADLFAGLYREGGQS